MSDFKGKGWAFPIGFNSEVGVDIISGEENIRQSIYMLLSTMPFERTCDPLFGVDLAKYVFSNIDESLSFEIRKQIQKAIETYEPRVLVKNITIEKHENLQEGVYINISYLVKETNSRSNLVFPYYLSEGSLIDNQYLDA